MSSFKFTPAGFDDSDDDPFDPDTKFDEPYVDYNPEHDDFSYKVQKTNNFDEYLNGLKFDYELGTEDDVLLNKLFIFYNETDDPKSQSMGNELLFTALEQKKEDIFNDNPFSFTLKLIINTNALDDPHGKSVPFKIVMGLNDFIQKQDQTQQGVLKCMITDFIKQVAFELSYKHLTFFKIVVSVFMLKDFCEPITNRIQTLLQNKNYKQVARIIDYLGYWNHFGPEEIIIPLIFRDALQVAQDLLVRMSKERKHETFRLIDSFFENEGNCDNVCKKFAKDHDIPGIKIVKLSAKPLMTTTKKLLALCDIMIEEFPNMSKIVRKNRLCNLLQHRYVQKTSNPVHSEIAIKELVEDNATDLQEIVIEYCTQYGHWSEAQKWCRWFKIPESKYLSQERRDQIEEETRDYDKNENEIKFPPFMIDTNVKIVPVNHSQEFERMCSLFERIKFVAIDVEGSARSATAALIQISTTRYIYIIDVIALEDERFDQEDWLKLKMSLFENKNILKIGFNWNADVAMIDRTFKWNLDLTNGSYLDAQKVWTDLCENPKFKLPHQYERKDKRKHEDLKTFVEHCTGRTLDKSLKRMDFSKKLTDKMIEYAAKDAYSLLVSYLVLNQEAYKCGVKVEKMVLK